MVFSGGHHSLLDVLLLSPGRLWQSVKSIYKLQFLVLNFAIQELPQVFQTAMAGGGPLHRKHKQQGMYSVQG